MSASPSHSVVRGLYAVTPDAIDTSALVAQVHAAVSGGVRVVQYRNKQATPDTRSAQARALKAVCDRFGAALIINDHVDLAAEVDAAGVHIGAADGEISAARRVLGADKLIGVSCYNQLELARSAIAGGADYIAFGSFFASSIKPGAVHAPLALLTRARRELSVPIVAIGGITIDNASDLINAGADAVAVISALFHASDIAAAARAFNAQFDIRSAG
ncbi:MAG: thiamine phosphate synthase [Pseudomonadota bacterium]